MAKTNLESGVDWADLRYNPVQGLCPNTDCSIYADCYMKRFPFRFSVDKNPTLRLDEKKLMVELPDEPKRIFVQDNLELFHSTIPSGWIQQIIKRTEFYPQHTFLFLTKNPARYAEFSFPENCWLGVTVTKQEDCERVEGVNGIVNLKVGKNRLFVSCEPLLGQLDVRAYHWDMLRWLIVGAMTGAKAKQYQPQREWVEHLVRHCTHRGLSQLNKPVFLKNNLKAVWGKDLIQEHPERRGR